MGASERGARRGARQAARRGDRRHQVRHGLPRQAEPPRQQRRAGARVDRQEPEAPRHRLRRRVHRALARPRHAVRGDDERARRRRARGQGALRRRCRTSSSTRSRRAWRSGASTSCSTAGTCSTGGWSPRSSRTARSTASGFMAYGSLAFGLLTGTFTEDHDFGTDDWRARQGKMGVDQAVRRALRPRTRSRQRRGRSRS